uniref:CCHC-type domain-containing protein n=1 Tax=Microcebus murinus TaxID=30608 RepID=A0A8C5V9W4_MICMU
MTRWARVSTTRNKRPLPATSWEDVKKESFKGTSQNLPKHKQVETNRLSLKNDAPPAKHKKNKKKKESFHEDVNGFMEYLRQNSQMVHNGDITATDNQEVREEIAVSTGRKTKRQAAEKNAMVYFHCRKPGHGIADCLAALENQDMGTGICYRCGSTEHEITKCKAKVDPAVGEFTFAKCFVCGEMGHLSRPCPDNPKGVCADGGDCPESQISNQMITVGHWAKGMGTDYEEILDAPKPQKPRTKIPKIVNF